MTEHLGLGSVAQQGERLLHTQEVIGSSPVVSTKSAQLLLCGFLFSRFRRNGASAATPWSGTIRVYAPLQYALAFLPVHCAGRFFCRHRKKLNGGFPVDFSPQNH